MTTGFILNSFYVFSLLLFKATVHATETGTIKNASTETRTSKKMIGKIDLLDREKSGIVEKEIFQNIPLVKENGNSCIIQIISEDSLKKFYLFKDGIYSFFLTYELFYFLVIIMKNKKFALRQYDDNIFAINLTEDELADVYETVSDLIPGSFDYHNKPTLITNKLELLVDIFML